MPALLIRYKARTRVTMFPISAIAEPEVVAGVAVVVSTTAEAGDATGLVEELVAEVDRAVEPRLDCGCGWLCGGW